MGNAEDMNISEEKSRKIAQVEGQLSRARTNLLTANAVLSANTDRKTFWQRYIRNLQERLRMLKDGE